MMHAQLFELALILGYALAAGGLLVALIRNVNYRITIAHLEVTLFGCTVRKIRLNDIKAITTKPVFLAECWCNTMLAENRVLVIQRYTGFFRNLVISPHYRFVFRSELVEAKRLFAVSLADRPLLVLPRRPLVQSVRDGLRSLQAGRLGQAMKKGFKACQAPGSLFS
jgi:hypothetical protein